MKQESLFTDENKQNSPLANRVRPQTLDEFTGQQHLLAPGQVLRDIIDQDQLPSIIFWGPPGVGKTTLARIIANKTKSHFITFSAVTSGIKDIRKIMEEAEDNRELGEKTKKIKPVDPQLLYELNRIGVNLNQIARYCNQQAIFQAEDKIDLLATLANIEEQLQALRESHAS